MTRILPALLVGLVGLPVGSLARLAASHDRQRQPGGQIRLLEMAMGLLWALLALRLWPVHPAALPAYLALAFACVVLTVVDLHSKLLPNRITYLSFPVIGVLLLAASLTEHRLDAMVRALEATTLAGLAFLALALISRSGLGGGDVKFALTLALALGWLGWTALVIGFGFAFLLGGVAALVAVVGLRLSRKAQLPFGPWLATGALLAVLIVTVANR